MIKRAMGLFMASVLVLVFSLAALAGEIALDLQVMEKGRDVKGITNVREKPDAKSKVVFVIERHPDDEHLRGVTVTGQKGNWFSVALHDTKETTGWMHSSVLGCFASDDGSGKGAQLYSAPDEGKPIKKTYAPLETPLFLTAVKEGWLKVAWTDKKGKKGTGWLPEDSIALDYSW